MPNDLCNGGLVCVQDLCENAQDYCGNGDCEEFEDAASCSEDCEHPAVCGDGVATGDEVCDGTDLGGSDCVLLGFTEGTLTCSATCDAFDATRCSVNLCGNGRIDAGEVCDGTDLGGQDCVTYGQTSGVLLCSSNCLFVDATNCNVSECDNTGDCNTCSTCAQDDLCEAVHQACNTSNACYYFGRCLENCSPRSQACYDSCAQSNSNGAALYEASQECVVCTQCYNDCDGANECGVATCGDGQLDPGEVCDGTALGGATCLDQGMTGGDLGCDYLCNSFVVDECIGCGSSHIDSGEVCDGTDLADETCVTQGFLHGPLGCAGDCQSLDMSACSTVCDNSGDCDQCMVCAEGGTCAPLMTACENNTDCQALLDCVDLCAPADGVCFDACIQSHQIGYQLLVAHYQCVVCSDCFNDCDGAGAECS